MKMFKKFIGYYRPHIAIFTLDMLASVVIAACNLFYPAVTKEIINNYVPNKLLSSLLIASGLLLVLYLIKAACNHFVSYQGHVMGIKMQKDMRRDLFAKYQKLPTSYFDDNKTGDLLSTFLKFRNWRITALKTCCSVFLCS